MKRLMANRVALALAMGASLDMPLPSIKSPLPPKDKTLADIGRMNKAAAKRLRKANKRIRDND